MNLIDRHAIVSIIKKVNVGGNTNLTEMDLFHAVACDSDGTVSITMEGTIEREIQQLLIASILKQNGVTACKFLFVNAESNKSKDAKASEAIVKKHAPPSSTGQLVTNQNSSNQKNNPDDKTASKMIPVKQTDPPKKRPDSTPSLPDGVDTVIAVASGKGGVGKSTITSNLAISFVSLGLKVGILDADVYGPSQPRMLGVSGRPSSPDGNIILPLRNHGITLMSLGLMVAEDEAIVWRGPMLMGALQQMLNQVQWGKLDVLIVDLPPGTGDVQMTLSQKTRLAGVVVVSTPQDIALLDALKGINMFRKMKVPILGLIENMASFVCGKCGATHHPFGNGGARSQALKLNIPFLGEIPLELDTRIASDGGVPIVVTKPNSTTAIAFKDIASSLYSSIKTI